MEQAVADFIEKYGIGLYIPKVHVTDVIEVLISDLSDYCMD